MTSVALTLPETIKASVILFPGQGNQYVGMVKNLCPRGRSLFEMANQVLGYDLLKLCQEGPEEELNRTIHSQPAIFVSSLAAVERLREMSREAVENCVATAGCSLGEFAALVFSQAMDFVEALRLVKLRAEVTQKICDSIPSGGITLFGNDERVKQICQMASEHCISSGLPVDESVCTIVVYVSAGIKIIAGHQKALGYIEHNWKDFGIERMKPLAVSGAFHSQLMKSARNDLRKALAKMNIKDPKISVYSNVDATAYVDANHIRASIEDHVYQPVMWEQIIQRIYGDERGQQAGFPVTFECGPGKHLTSTLGRINLKAKQLAYNIEP